MTKFYPNEISTSIRRDSNYKAEIKFYDALQNEALNNNNINIIVYYSVNYSKDQNFIPRECDFIIILPKHGIAFIEIKGGGIEYNGETDTWYSISYVRGKNKLNKDPLKDQAQAAEFFFRKKLNTFLNLSQLTQSFVGFIDIRDVAIKSANYPQHYKPELILSLDDIEKGNIINKIKNLFNKKSFNNKLNLGKDEINEITEIFKPSFSIKPYISDIVKGEQDEQINLTDQQNGIINLFRNRKKVVVEGGAGTGKTLLAIEKAKRLALEKKHVLLLVHSKSLQMNFWKKFILKNDNKYLHLHNPFTLTQRLAKQLNYDYENYLEDFKNEEEKFNEGYPALLELLLIKEKEKSDKEIFDAYIIDEGQRFNDDWYLALDNIIPKDGIRYIFYDPNQNIDSFKTSDFLTEELENSVPLTQNIRNTMQIFETCKILYKGMEIECKGPKGERVNWIDCAYESQSLKISLNIQELINNGVIASDIGIINFNPLINYDSILDEFKKKGKDYKMNDLLSSDDNYIAYDTVANFQGLEFPYIFIINFPDEIDDKIIPELYTALTRASNRLTVISNMKSNNKIKQILN